MARNSDGPELSGGDSRIEEADHVVAGQLTGGVGAAEGRLIGYVCVAGTMLVRRERTVWEGINGLANDSD